MIILDTNILSELMNRAPNPKVLKWFDAQAPQMLATTSITVAELHFGLNSMAAGKRRDELEKAIAETLDEDFQNSILDFDLSAAEAYGVLAARLRRNGTPIGQSDTMIAAIALTHEATLATRNTRHFIHCGIDVVDPFSG